jgi:hypothetical protein
MPPLGRHRRREDVRPAEFGSGGMSPDWALMRHILTLLADDDGLADAEIAGRLDRSTADVRQAASVLYRQHKVDFVSGYLVTVPQRQGRRAA